MAASPFDRGSRAAHPIDLDVGAVIREKRLLREMTQEALAKRLGITPQQVQKYEVGENRVSASRLAGIAQVLGVPIVAFFSTPGSRRGACTAENLLQETMQRRETIDLVNSYYAIKDRKARKRILHLVKAAASGQ